MSQEHIEIESMMAEYEAEISRLKAEVERLRTALAEAHAQWASDCGASRNRSACQCANCVALHNEKIR